MAARTYVALLRGINLGSQRRVGMATLRELLTGHGHGDVRTYLQSGNIVLESALSRARLEQTLERQLATELGFDVDVLVRTGAELATILKRNPLRRMATDPSRYLVTFLREPLAKQVVQRLTAAAASPERIAASGRELYSWHPGGVGRSKLATLLQPNALGVPASARNWRVVGQLAALAADD